MIGVLTPASHIGSVSTDVLPDDVTALWDDAWPDKDPVGVADQVLATPLDAIVIGPGVEPEVAIGWMAEFHTRSPRAMVFVGPVEAADMVAMTRLGATDFLPQADHESDWNEMIDRCRGTIERIRVTAAQSIIADRGRLIVVSSARGGCGRTTVATNLAMGLAEHDSTVLIDLDLEFGDVASSLALETEHTMFDAAEMVRVGCDPVAMRVLLDRFNGGPHILSAPTSLAEASAIRPEDTKTILKQLLDHFAYVVVDCPAGLGDQTLAALEVATDVVLVATPTTQSLRTLKTTCEVLDILELGAERHLMANLTEPREKNLAEAMEQGLAMPLVAAVPRTRVVADSMQRGMPFFESGATRDVASRAFAPLVGRFLSEEVAPAKQRPRRRWRG